ncbi:MAG: hypothetical protein ACD_55C00083G0003 [uncultured bacterium]|uniref:Secreted protein n=1 Tax=Citrifermentans bemidjiense (strain ATCC BAA-1014 / DSM 16622 / JCM 12645 / Bem) TaxID=404380 RepID=B5EE63_CITBB|nr:hypothetical protein [Citrifermentans bemidjiense]ACH37801.1 hypothetical protein Gbem_0775 [Citrifermentans bemidjiense Bem]EKD59306.1 MAG: hypothetical protein ACD_55C00083G0003 [uncultured bacterium]
MKINAFVWMILALLASTPPLGAEPVQLDEDSEPRLDMPCPPHTPLRFVQTKGRVNQSLEVRYVDARTIAFKLDKSGRCSRHEQGTATIKENWWLGAETDENETGDMIPVREYVFEKSKQCTIYVRIDETEWKQATVKESSQCSKSCPASEEAMGNEK